MVGDVRRRVPSLDVLLRSEPAVRASRVVGRPVLKRTLSLTLDEVRASARKGVAPPEDDEILARAIGRADAAVVGLMPVINATGVVLHTNLGRAPLADDAVLAVARTAREYTDLEVDRETGKRGRRSARADLILAALTGAEDALVVNNCAAALMLALAALAKGKQVLVSRGELIEIGGEFRIPDIMAASGARLVEVGTTNRTRMKDYRSALTDRTGAILKVHPSNYRVTGFTATVEAKDLAALAHDRNLPLLYDAGSGLLEKEQTLPGEEPTAKQVVRDGADLVTFSGDKLLGGPQAGCIVGRADLVAKLRSHPIARAVRVDKLQIAALEATLVLHATGRHDEVPAHRMLHESADEVSRRAHRLAETIGGDLKGAQVERTESVVGGGSMPGTTIPSWAVVLKAPDTADVATRLRTGPIPVLCRVDQERVILDCRTVPADSLRDLARAVQYALEGEDLDER
jgi:L-seryl-tRNA(Ser) seleniumtransferase